MNVIDKVLDEAKIQAQLDKLDSQLSKTAGNLDECAKKAQNFNSALSNAKGINDITKWLTEYNKVVQQASVSQQDAEKIERMRADTQIKLSKAAEISAKAELLKSKAQINTTASTINLNKSEAELELRRTKSTQTTERQIRVETAMMQAKGAIVEVLTREGLSVDKLNISKREATTISNLVDKSTKSEIGSREQLSAQFELNYKAYSKLSAAQRDTSAGKAFQKSILEQNEALKSMESGVGVHTRSIGNYGMATKMLGINVGQILKEIPNFAISARTGIMSLTNNLIPLSETIKQVRTEQLKMIADGQKAPSMFSLIAKSVLGLTGIMSIVVTLFTIFGEDIIKWVGKVIKGQSEIKKLSDAQLGLLTSTKALNKTMKDGGGVYNDAISSVTRLKIELEKSVGNKKTAKKAVDDYNKSLGVTFGKVTSVDEALRKIKDNEKDYIEAMKNMAYANTFFNASSENMVKILDISTKSNAEILGESGDKLKKDVETAAKRLDSALKGNAPKEWKNTWNAAGQKVMQLVPVLTNVLEQDLKQAEKAYNNAALSEKNRQILRIKDTNKLMLNEAEKYYTEYITAFKEHNWVFNEEDGERSNRYRELRIKDFEWALKIQESLAKTEQDEYQYRIDMFNLEIDKKIDAVDDYIKELNVRKNEISSALSQTSNKQEITNLTKQLNQINSVISESQSKRTALIDQYEKERLKGIADINYQEIEIRAKKDSDILSQTQDFNNTSLQYQQKVSLALFDIQMMADRELYLIRYQTGKLTLEEYSKSLAALAAKRTQFMLGQQRDLSSLLTGNKTSSEVIEESKKQKELIGLYESGQITATEYEKRSYQLKEKYSHEKALLEIEGLKLQLSSYKETDDQFISIQAEIAQKELDIDQKRIDKKLDNEKRLQQAIVDGVKETAALIQEIGDNQFQAELDRIEAKKAIEDSISDQKIESIQREYESGVLTQKESEAQTAEIQKQKEQREKRYNAENLAIRRKQAKFDKEMSIFNIGLNTASSIMQIWADPTLFTWAKIAMTAIAGATGALQLGAAMSKQLPQYEKGTSDHKGGLAVVGEKRSEMVILPHGEIIKTPNEPTIMNLPVHARVLPDWDKAVQEMTYNASISSIRKNDIDVKSYNDYAMRTYLKGLITATKKQTNSLETKLDRINSSNIEGAKFISKEIKKAIKTSSKSPWVN